MSAFPRNLFKKKKNSKYTERINKFTSWFDMQECMWCVNAEKYVLGDIGILSPLCCVASPLSTLFDIDAIWNLSTFAYFSIALIHMSRLCIRVGRPYDFCPCMFMVERGCVHFFCSSILHIYAFDIVIKALLLINSLPNEHFTFSFLPIP